VSGRGGLAVSARSIAGCEGGAVIPVPPGVRVPVATKPVDFRKGADSLAALAKETLAQDPFWCFAAAGPTASRSWSRMVADWCWSRRNFTRSQRENRGKARVWCDCTPIS
jgi:hypothetical protein